MNGEKQPPSSSDHLPAVYAAGTNQWIHAEQMRWTILYNFLVGNTILLLAWATLYATLLSHPGSLGLRIVLIGSCFVGICGGVVWTFLEHRANGFSEQYFKTGLDLERLLLNEQTDVTGPFLATEQHRAHGGPIKTHVIVVAVPIVFSTIYLVLLIVSICAALSLW